MHGAPGAQGVWFVGMGNGVLGTGCWVRGGHWVSGWYFDQCLPTRLLTMKLCLLLVCLVATVTATVTPVSVARGRGLPAARCPPPAHPHRCPRAQVPTPETTPSGRVKPIRLQPAQTVFPRLWDTGTPTQPVPSSNASTTEEPSLDAVLEALEPLGPVEFVAAPEESGTAANGSVATPEPETTTGPPSTPPDTINPPCPGDEEPAETCWAPTREQKEDVAMALGTFALRFYQHMAESAKPDTNLLFSPLNVALGLSHLLLGEGLPVVQPTHPRPSRLPGPAEPHYCPQVPAVRPSSAWLPSWGTSQGWPACTAPCSSLSMCQGCSPPQRSSTTQVRQTPAGRNSGVGKGVTSSMLPCRPAPPTPLLE